MRSSFIDYVPPVTLDEAVVRARVRIRKRDRRASRVLVLAVLFLGLLLLETLAALFPSDPAAEVPLLAIGYFLGVTAAFLLLCLATYRIMTDRPGAAYVVAAVGGLLVAFYTYTMWAAVQAFLDQLTTGFADPNTRVLTVAGPAAGLVAGVLAVLGALLALPRAVRILDVV